MSKSEREQQTAAIVAAVNSLPVAGSIIDFQADAGKGQEGADQESYAIPFLLVLQPLSPQVMDGKIEGAKAGMFIDSVTNSLYDSPLIVPCAFQRRHVRWQPRETGGGFKGELTTSQVNELRAAGKIVELEGRLYVPDADGSVNPKKSDRIADTRNHYVLALRDAADEMPVAMVFALASTGIKVSKNLMSRIEGVKLRGPNGLFNPPSFSHMYSVKTQLKTNEKGKWWQPEVDMVGPIKNPVVYNAAKAFHARVSAGKVDVAHDSVRDVADAESDSGDARV